MKRRLFLQAILAATTAGALRANQHRPPRILLRSSWQMVNIGDIAHTPGVLALLEKHLPEAEVVLWASRNHSQEVAEMEQRRFPWLRVVKGTIDAEGQASNAELGEAISRADFLLHGSGPSLVAEKDVAAFVRHTGKPFGVYGITYGGAGQEQQELLSRAEFVFFRDSVSLEKAKADGIDCPVMEFGPDGAFAVDLRDDEAAERFLQQHDLQEGKFLCCIPRLRYTPYWKIHRREMTETEHERHEYNVKMQEHDHAPLRDTMTEIVRQTEMKVLVCPEDMSQMEVGRRLLVDKLPADVRENVVWREKFWLTDEALSTYVRSAGLFGLEMHSPIMCIGNGVPAIVCRFAEQTSKGFMWRDIGLDPWLIDMDKPEEVARLTPAVLSLVNNREHALDLVRNAQEVVHQRQRHTMGILKSVTAKLR